MISFKLPKDSATELWQPHKRTVFKAQNQPHKRSSANEITKKLEPVNGKIDANTPHIVPPERT
ncbi:hypothetical protein CGH57_22385 [Vibrio parahaemolyticus]|nr:hypothetical protein CGH57_22385 [Vibrio parahaemolyticus]